MLKPAETTPLTALLLAEVIQQAELPAGVVNVITGAGRQAPRSSPPTWTRSRSRLDGGRQADPRTIAGTGKRLTLELGGKAANIVFEDAPLDQAVEGVVNGSSSTRVTSAAPAPGSWSRSRSSSRCSKKLKARLQTLRVGDPLDKNTDIGAINSRAQLEKIEELVASGVEEGAEMYQPACDLPARGFWFVRPSSRA